MTRAATLPRRSSIISEAIAKGCHIKLYPDGTVEILPPNMPPPPSDQFDLVDMKR